MKIYKSATVFDEALKRIRLLFDEFPNVVVGISGGKDSTVVFNLSMMVAKEKNRLPLKVLFLDQEAEWDATIDQVKFIMYNEDVQPLWMQIPFRIFNATSTQQHWLQCWNPEDEANWIREKEGIAYKENIYGEDRFAAMFAAIIRGEYPTTKTCYIAGVRTEESPGRFLGLTSHATYKWITWGNSIDKKRNHYTFYPIYDWSYTDVWKAIHDNKWPYNKIYDVMYSYGIPVQKMRVSNLHHETAVHSLFYMQEVEPHNYEKLCARLQGIDMAGKLGKKDYFVKDLPFMFRDWKEYRDFLLEKLIDNPKWKADFAGKFARMDKRYKDISDINEMHKMHVQSILTNDWEFVKINNWERSPLVDCYRKYHEKGIKIFHAGYDKLIKK